MVSVVVPLYNEEDNLEPLNNRLSKALNSLGTEYEIIYIDDGSKDNSPNLLKEFNQKDSRVKFITLAKNFGQTLAIQAGIDYSKGEIIIILDADLQNDPADISKLLEKIHEGYDVVSGWRKIRNDPFFSKKIPSFFANRLIMLLSGIRIHDLGCALKAYKRVALERIRLYGEMHRLLPLYAAMRGAKIAEVEVSHNPRFSGKTHYGLMRIFKVCLDLITVRFFDRYSTRPMYFFGSVGMIFFISGMLLGCAVILRTLLLGGIWISPLLFISLLFFAAGIQLILIGLVAEILIRIYYKSRHEEPYLIKNKLI